jgi:hypothetical protein
MPFRRIYRHIGVPTECIKNYRPGGFHPVHIEDRLGPMGAISFVENLAMVEIQQCGWRMTPCN